MRLSFLCLFVLLLFCFESFSQQHQISGGMGIGSLTFHRLHDLSFSRKNVRERREVRLSYAYSPQERWQFGGTVTYGHSKSDLTPLFSNDVVAHRYVDFYGIAGETSYIFHNREKIKLYALVGAGISFGKETAITFLPEEHFVTDHTFFEFQITPIGIRYGKKWGGFAEAGFGYRGVISAGLFYNL